jgi:hypothetical protein
MRLITQISTVCVFTLVLVVTGCSDKKKKNTYSPSTEQQADDGNQQTDSNSTSGDQTTGNSTDSTQNNGTNTESDTPSSASTVTLQGQITYFPDNASEDARPEDASFIESVQSDDSALQGPEVEEYSLSHEDMQPKEAWVTLHRLDDIDYQDPIAEVATDESGNYEIKVEDVRPYLEGKGIIEETASDDIALAAFKSIGEIQVRALIVEEDDQGNEKVIAIQSLADPNEVDETTGEPKPVKVNPIAHRVVKAIMEQIRDSMSSLRELGVTEEKVAELSKSAIKEIAKDIRRAVRESAESRLPIPVGKSPREVIAEQTAELEIAMSDDEKTKLKAVVKGQAEDKKAAMVALREAKVYTKKSAKKITKLVSTLGSGEQGVLSQLKKKMKERVTGKVEKVLDEGDDDSVKELFGIDDDSVDLAQIKEERKAKAKDVSKRALKDFFLSMGFSVVMARNEAGDAGVIAMPLMAAEDRFSSQLIDWPFGGEYTADSPNVRLFKIGTGELASDSRYTTDKAQHEADANIFYAQPIDEVMTGLLNGETLETFNANADAAFNRIMSGTPTSEDFAFLDQLMPYQILNEELMHATLIPLSVIDKAHESKSSMITLKGVAATIAEYFEWKTEAVHTTDEGFPLFTGRHNLLPGTQSEVSASEILKSMSVKLRKTVKETASLLTEHEGFYTRYAIKSLQKNIDDAHSLDSVSTLYDTLALAFPRSKSQMKEMVVGSRKHKASEDFVKARDKIIRGLTTAMPEALFGTKLNSETQLNLPASIFFIDYLAQIQFRIHERDGFVKSLKVKGRQASKQADRFVLNFNNIKYLSLKDGVTPAMVISKLMNMSALPSGGFYQLAQDEMMVSLQGLPHMAETEAPAVADFVDDLGARQDHVAASCVIERPRHIDPAVGNNALTAKVTAVTYDMLTGEIIENAVVDSATLDIRPVPGTGNTKTEYRFEDLPTFTMQGGDKVYGVDYRIEFEHPTYQTRLPELHLWADGYLPEIMLCDAAFPLFIGDDKKIMPLPELSLVSDQMAFDMDGNERGLEGVDISNFTETGKPIYLTEKDEAEGLGAIDILLTEKNDVPVLTGTTGSKVAFAPIYGEFVSDQWQFSLDASQGEPLESLHSMIDVNIHALIDQVRSDDSLLQTDIMLTDGENDDKLDQLYLMRDAEGEFWIIQLSMLEEIEMDDEHEEIIVGFHFVHIDSLGHINVPAPVFDVGLDFFKESSVFTEHLFVEKLTFGDWLVLSAPEGFDAKGVFPAPVVSFDDGGKYLPIKDAQNGIVLRFAGAAFDELFPTKADFSENIDMIDETSVMPTLEATRDGIELSKISFSPYHQSYSSTTTFDSLESGDLIAVSDTNTADGKKLLFLGRVLAADTEEKHLVIEWANYEQLEGMPIPADGQDDRQVICESDVCAGMGLPSLVTEGDSESSDVFIMDADFDGVPSLFDPNDYDSLVESRHHFEEKREEVLSQWVYTKNDLDETVVQLGIGIMTFPGEIASIKLHSALFGSDQIMTFVECTQPDFSLATDFSSFGCMTKDGLGTVKSVEMKALQDELILIVSLDSDTLASLADSTQEVGYEVQYQMPMDKMGGLPLCDSPYCAGKEPLKGNLKVSMTEQAYWPGLFSAPQLIEEGSEPVALSSANLLALENPTTISANSIADASSYELDFFCVPDVIDHTPWITTNHVTYESPAMNEIGESVSPEFMIFPEDFHGNVICSVELIATIENEKGRHLSRASFTDIRINGTTGVMIDPDLEVEITDITSLLPYMAGDKACMMGMNGIMNDAACLDEQVLFTLAPFGEGDLAGKAGLIFPDHVTTIGGEAFASVELIGQGGNILALIGDIVMSITIEAIDTSTETVFIEVSFTPEP